jgi:lysyl-tRNA synthetase class 2
MHGNENKFLQTSPEPHMKRLLAEDSGSIYQFAHCFRSDERGPHHDTEFTMLEWYQPGANLTSTAELVTQLLHDSLHTDGLQRLPCRDAFIQHADIDPITAGVGALLQASNFHDVGIPESISNLPAEQQWSLAFELLLSEVVSPQLGIAQPTMLESWPASESAFAQLDSTNKQLSLRFEVFVAGIELMNGWQEETCSSTIRKRLEKTNTIRTSFEKQKLPLPNRLLAVHDNMPEGVGVALGFDRLVMLATGTNSIDAIRYFNSDNS